MNNRTDYASAFACAAASDTPKPLGELLEARSGVARPKWLPQTGTVPPAAVSTPPEPESEPQQAQRPQEPAESVAPPSPPSPDPVVTQRMLESIEALSAATSSLANAPDVVELAMAVAQAVLRQEILTRPEVVVEAVQSALDGLRGETPTRVRLHTSSLEAVRSARPDLELDGIELVSDDALGEGGCIVEGAHRAIDASLQERLERFRTAFVSSLAGGED